MNYYISMELESSTSQSEGVEKKELTQEDKKPEFVIIMGGICSGKTTFRKEEYSNGYVNIDAGEIFIELSQGKCYDFPSHLEDEMNRLGVAIIKRCLKDRCNMVTEIIGSDEGLVKDLASTVHMFNYSVKLIHVQCEEDQAVKRLQKRNAMLKKLMKRKNYNSYNDNISAFFCEKYHLLWFQQAALAAIDYYFK